MHRVRGRSRSQRGFTLIELLIVVAIIGIIAAIATHQLLRARVAANEASAIGSLRSVSSGETGYAATCGGGFFAPTIATLVDGKYISADMNYTPKSGYVYTLEPGDASGNNDCQGNPTHNSFYAKAERVSPGTGNRAFATNASGTIWQSFGNVAPAEPFLTTSTIQPIQ